MWRWKSVRWEQLESEWTPGSMVRPERQQGHKAEEAEERVHFGTNLV